MQTSRNMAIRSLLFKSNRSMVSRNEVIGAWIATPQFLKEETLALNAEVRSMDAELGEERAKWPATLDAKQAAMDTWWKSAWIPFMQSWTKFYEDHGNTWGLRNWYENFWGTPVWDGLNNFRTRLRALYSSAQQVGYFFTVPAPTAPKVGWMESGLESIGTMFKTAFYAILIGGLLIGLIFVIRR